TSSGHARFPADLGAHRLADLPAISPSPRRPGTASRPQRAGLRKIVGTYESGAPNEPTAMAPGPPDVTAYSSTCSWTGAVRARSQWMPSLETHDVAVPRWPLWKSPTAISELPMAATSVIQM